MPLHGEKARKYSREYQRKRRAAIRAASQAIVEAVLPGQHRPTLVSQNGETAKVGQAVLQKVLDKSNLTLERVIGKVGEKLDAGRLFNAYETVKGKTRSVTISGQDNDAQLRAAELAVNLHERAGTIPSAPSNGGPSGSHITVNILTVETMRAMRECNPVISLPVNVDA